MKLKRLNGYEQIININKIKNRKKENVSINHRNVKSVLKSLFPHLSIIEELPIDGLFLDFYIYELSTAIEVDGSQHKKFTKFYHNNYVGYLTAKQNDYKKEQLCDLNNIKLIRICHTIAKNIDKTKRLILEKINGR